jgi:CheY-like chemotaxis protein
VAPRQTPARQLLLVEDDAAVRDATRMLLGAAGYQVTVAGSMAEALAKATAMPVPPDLVITDYHLGAGETGMQVLAALSAAAGKDLKAVVITGDTSSAMREPARQGAAHCQQAHDPTEFLAVIGQPRSNPVADSAGALVWISPGTRLALSPRLFANCLCVVRGSYETATMSTVLACTRKNTA